MPRTRARKRRDLGRVVLAVGVERDDRGRSRIERVAEPGAQGRALAGIRDLAQDGRPGRSAAAAVSSLDPSSMTTTGRWRRGGRDDRADARAFLEGRDEREDRAGRSVTGRSIAGQRSRFS